MTKLNRDVNSLSRWGQTTPKMRHVNVCIAIILRICLRNFGKEVWDINLIILSLNVTEYFKLWRHS